MKDIQGLTEKISEVFGKLKHYSPYLFALFILALYGYLMYQINTLNAAQPSPADVTTQSQTASVPHVDPKLISQLQSLQDNSTSVKTLFDNARQNPFQE